MKNPKIIFSVCAITTLSFLVFHDVALADNEETVCSNLNDASQKLICCSNLADEDPQKQLCLGQVESTLKGFIQAEQGQALTLKSQLNQINTQTQLSQLKIAETNAQMAKLEREINDLSGRITKLSSMVDTLSQVLLNRIIQTYKYGNYSTLDLLFSSNGFSDLLLKTKYLQVAQENDKKVLYQLQATKSTYNDQKVDKETRQAQEEKLKKDLERYQKQLTDQKKAKQDLLIATQNDEVVYQKLLAQAQAQLAGFQRFTQGKASILTDQTVCDDWGCYYNQRDAKWGNISLNNTQYSIASDGCLLTSMAMIYTHYGHRDVTPISINSNSDNFASYFPAYLKYTISTNGITSSRANSIIDNELSAGRPVIIGIGSGPDHFIVFISGSNGNYKMNDPFIPNGHNINFTDHYSLSSIAEINKVIF